MSWTSRLLKASFRGVKFFVEDHERGGGRRIVTHEYPLRDKAFIEDLGRATRRFNLNAYVVGPDYMAARDALIDALEAPGPGELVHPYHGSFTVQAGDFSQSERKSDGGYAAFSLQFFETVNPIYPTVAKNKKFSVNAAANRLAEVVQLDYIGKVITDGYPQFVKDALGSESLELLGTIGDVVSGSGDTIAAFNLSSLNMRSTLTSLLGNPAAMAFGFTDLIQQAGTILGTQGKSQSSLKSLTSAVVSVSEPQTTPSRIQSGINRQAIVDLVRQVSVSERARLIIEEDFQTYDEAIAARDELSDEIEAIADTASDEVVRAIVALRSEIVSAVPNADESLPRIRSVQYGNSIPSILVAYDLYEEPERGDEIASRNMVRHPGFMPSNRELKVLTNG